MKLDSRAIIAPKFSRTIGPQADSLTQPAASRPDPCSVGAPSQSDSRRRMFRVTFLSITESGPAIISVTHPNLAVAKSIHDAFVAARVHVRLWDAQNRLIKP